MRGSLQFLAILICTAGMMGLEGHRVAGQTPPPGKLIIFSDTVLFAGPGRPRNCFAMNRFKVGDPVGFRISVMDGATGQPAADATAVVHLTYGGKTEDVPARYRGVGRGNIIPNMWSAEWVVPQGAPTGIVKVKITASDKMGRTAEWTQFPNEAGLLTIVNE